jgi:hypothetical protein
MALSARYPGPRWSLLGALALPVLVAACGGSSTSDDDSSGGSSSSGTSGKGSGGSGTGGSGTGGSGTGGSGTGGSGGSGAGGSTGKGGGSGSSGTGGSVTAGSGGALQTQCEGLCNEAQACPDATAENCGTDCVTLIDSSSACLAELGAYFDCAATADICNQTSASPCYDELQRYATCMQTPPTGGCGATRPSAPVSCLSLCEQAKSCPGNETTDCASECTSALSQVEMAGCSTQYQNLLDCASVCSDACVSNLDGCATEVNDVTTCLITYCTAYPSSPTCA